MDSSDEFFYHHFIEASSSSSSSDDDDLLIVTAILLWDAQQNALPKYRGSTRGRAVVNRDRAARRLVLHDDYYKPAVKTPKMADKEHAQTSRKRVSEKQINKDNLESDDDSPEQEAGIFNKASEEVMATRRDVTGEDKVLVGEPKADNSKTSGSKTEDGHAELKPKKFAMPEVPVETGEENEKAVFTADSAIYEYLDGGWKERGKGELKLNITVTGGERPRLIMRANDNYRLILNASLYGNMVLKDMEKKGMTFACIKSIGESPSELTTFALKFKDNGVREDFKAAVEMHKARKASDA